MVVHFLELVEDIHIVLGSESVTNTDDINGEVLMTLSTEGDAGNFGNEKLLTIVFNWLNMIRFDVIFFSTDFGCMGSAYNYKDVFG